MDEPSSEEPTTPPCVADLHLATFGRRRQLWGLLRGRLGGYPTSIPWHFSSDVRGKTSVVRRSLPEQVPPADSWAASKLAGRGVVAEVTLWTAKKWAESEASWGRLATPEQAPEGILWVFHDEKSGRLDAMLALVKEGRLWRSVAQVLNAPGATSLVSIAYDSAIKLNTPTRISKLPEHPWEPEDYRGRYASREVLQRAIRAETAARTALHWPREKESSRDEIDRRIEPDQCERAIYEQCVASIEFARNKAWGPFELEHHLRAAIKAEERMRYELQEVFGLRDAYVIHRAARAVDVAWAHGPGGARDSIARNSEALAVFPGGISPILGKSVVFALLCCETAAFLGDTHRSTILNFSPFGAESVLRTKGLTAAIVRSGTLRAVGSLSARVALALGVGVITNAAAGVVSALFLLLVYPRIAYRDGEVSEADTLRLNMVRAISVAAPRDHNGHSTEAIRHAMLVAGSWPTVAFHLLDAVKRGERALMRFEALDQPD